MFLMIECVYRKVIFFNRSFCFWVDGMNFRLLSFGLFFVREFVEDVGIIWFIMVYILKRWSERVFLFEVL